jgi:predicted acetyltransferase
MTRLVFPDVRYQNSFIAAMEEFQAEGRQTDLSLRQLEQHFPEFIARLRDTHHPPPDSGLVPETLYWAVDDREYIGHISLRHRLNPSLERYGGHIGYEVRPSRRREGHGTRMLALLLPHARRLGLQRVLITCSEDNIGSRKIIQTNGGQLQDIIQNEFQDVPTMRWWIDL